MAGHEAPQINALDLPLAAAIQAAADYKGDPTKFTQERCDANLSRLPHDERVKVEQAMGVSQQNPVTVIPESE